MEVASFVEVITTVGFPIAATIALGIFVYIIYKNMIADNKANIAAI